MIFKAAIGNKLFRPAIGAGLAALCGLALWKMPLGGAFANASYDYLFRFGARPVTNKLVLIVMDNHAYDQYQQVRRKPWDRALHTNLLNRLANDHCPLVVFDVFFEKPGDPAVDAALAGAMRRQRQTVLMAGQLGSEYPADPAHPRSSSVQAKLPTEPFLSAAQQNIGQTNWGVGAVDSDFIVRRHWPFPSPGAHPSLPWTAASLAGAPLSDVPQKRWLRYYGMQAAWQRVPYGSALTRNTNYFSDKIVFIGSEPEKKDDPHLQEEDKFRTPYTRWSGESAGGVEILATQFLNLMNGDWLRRAPWWIEALVLVGTGLLLGGILCQVSPVAAGGVAIGASVLVSLGAVSLSYFSNFWFPWLIIVAGQVPLSIAWAFVSRWRGESILASYEVAQAPFGKGAYGEVFLARHKASGQWFAFKKVYREKFKDPDPYEREFRGITRYLPVSIRHPGLLHVHYVGRDEREAHFFYVMDLGDAQAAGWERNLATYKPRDLANVCAQAEGQRLPVRECVRIVLALVEALDFLHRQGLLHRDIKPQNIIFVKDQPKLADIGLVAEIQPANKENTWVGTPGYMPPLPEPPGTLPADIYSLGMVLYVISTGNQPALFPEISSTLVERISDADFLHLNPVILMACAPDIAKRYASAAEMQAALLKVQQILERATRLESQKGLR